MLYLFAREWGIQPSEFWNMTMSEWFCEWEFRHGDNAGTEGTYAGKLTQGDVDELMDVMEMSDQEWKASYGSTRH